MSSSSAFSPAVVQEIITSLAQGRDSLNAGVAAAALAIFDYFLTLSDERKHMWKKEKKSLVFFLFTMLRYSTLAYQITFNFSFFLPIKSTKGCQTLVYLEEAFWILSSTGLSGVFALRTFAIYKRNWYILAILIIVATAKIFMSATDFFVAAKVTVAEAAFAKYASCSENLGTDYPKFNTSSAALALLFDTIVISLTVGKTVKQAFQARKVGVAQGYSYYILRDGLLYYTAIEILLLFTVIFNQVPSLSLSVAKVVIILQTSMAPVIAQRLVLNLRNVDLSHSPSNTEDDDSRAAGAHTKTPSADSLQFAHGSMLGNIGAPLRTTSWNDPDDFDEDEEFARGRSGGYEEDEEEEKGVGMGSSSSIVVEEVRRGNGSSGEPSSSSTLGDVV